MSIDFLLKLRDAAQMIADAANEQLEKMGKPAEEVKDHPEVYEKINWENRDSEHGPFQMLRKDNCNDLQLYNHLEASLKQNKNNVSIGDWHYWAGDEGFIFRRRKKPQAEK